MGSTTMIGILFFVVIGGLILLDAVGEKGSPLSIRKKQAEGLTSENSIRKRFNEYTTKKVKYDKRYKAETLCMTAGQSKMKYSDLVMLNMLTSFSMFFAFGIIAQNIVLGLVLAFVGWNIPTQVLMTMRNRRIVKLEKQIGIFMNMTIKRYVNTSDFERSLVLTMEEFKGIEPMHTEIKHTVAEIKVGVAVGEALDNLARRTGNSFMARFADFYKIAYRLGTDEVREKLLTQAYAQFEENQSMKDFMRKEISEPVRDAYIMVIALPVFIGFGIFAMPGYFEFMFQTTPGKIFMGVIVAIVVGIIWFINTKIAAPLDK